MSNNPYVFHPPVWADWLDPTLQLEVNEYQAKLVAAAQNTYGQIANGRPVEFSRNQARVLADHGPALAPAFFGSQFEQAVYEELRKQGLPANLEYQVGAMFTKGRADFGHTQELMARWDLTTPAAAEAHYRRAVYGPHLRCIVYERPPNFPELVQQSLRHQGLEMPTWRMEKWQAEYATQYERHHQLFEAGRVSAEHFAAVVRDQNYGAETTLTFRRAGDIASLRAQLNTTEQQQQALRAERIELLDSVRAQPVTGEPSRHSELYERIEANAVSQEVIAESFLALHERRGELRSLTPEAIAEEIRQREAAVADLHHNIDVTSVAAQLEADHYAMGPRAEIAELREIQILQQQEQLSAASTARADRVLSPAQQNLEAGIKDQVQRLEGQLRHVPPTANPADRALAADLRAELVQAQQLQLNILEQEIAQDNHALPHVLDEHTRAVEALEARLSRDDGVDQLRQLRSQAMEQLTAARAGQDLQAETRSLARVAALDQEITSRVTDRNAEVSARLTSIEQAADHVRDPAYNTPEATQARAERALDRAQQLAQERVTNEAVKQHTHDLEQRAAALDEVAARIDRHAEGIETSRTLIAELRERGEQRLADIKEKAVNAAELKNEALRSQNVQDRAVVDAQRKAVETPTPHTGAQPRMSAAEIAREIEAQQQMITRYQQQAQAAPDQARTAQAAAREPQAKIAELRELHANALRQQAAEQARQNQARLPTPAQKQVELALEQRAQALEQQLAQARQTRSPEADRIARDLVEARQRQVQVQQHRVPADATVKGASDREQRAANHIRAEHEQAANQLRQSTEPSKRIELMRSGEARVAQDIKAARARGDHDQAARRQADLEKTRSNIQKLQEQRSQEAEKAAQRLEAAKARDVELREQVENRNHVKDQQVEARLEAQRAQQQAAEAKKDPRVDPEVVRQAEQRAEQAAQHTKEQQERARQADQQLERTVREAELRAKEQPIKAPEPAPVREPQRQPEPAPKPPPPRPAPPPPHLERTMGH